MDLIVWPAKKNIDHYGGQLLDWVGAWAFQISGLCSDLNNDLTISQRKVALQIFVMLPSFPASFQLSVTETTNPWLNIYLLVIAINCAHKNTYARKSKG